MREERGTSFLFAWSKNPGRHVWPIRRVLVTDEGIDSPIALKVQEPRVRILLRLDEARARRRLRTVRGRRRRRCAVGRAIKLLLIIRDGVRSGGLRLTKLLRLPGYQGVHGLIRVELIVPAEERPIGRWSLVLLRERARERECEGRGRRGSERRDLVCTC